MAGLSLRCIACLLPFSIVNREQRERREKKESDRVRGGRREQGHREPSLVAALLAVAQRRRGKREQGEAGA
jgi:hypothetical protein